MSALAKAPGFGRKYQYVCSVTKAIGLQTYNLVCNVVIPTNEKSPSGQQDRFFEDPPVSMTQKITKLPKSASGVN
jgi:hypothetical protein